ncbi:CNNM domain-containing protein [Novipirellula rosea]|uniref:CNNM domain-containing protein n=1 Tax=Novipirellula rosea TaxID=1031540 RepID=A0ABP8MWL6_9BACT
MSSLLAAWGWLLVMGVLILLSALFSGSEAAFFSLPHRERLRLKRRGVTGRMAASMLDDSDRLLSAILFWNLLINMTYFAIASIVGTKLQDDPAGGSSLAVGFTAGSLMMIIFFSEMLPKSIAVLAPARLCLLVAPPLNIAVKIVGPVLPLVKTTNLAVSRLIWPSFRPEPEIDLADIERAIELGTDDAALLQRERIVLSGLVEMAEIRVAELMRLRSKLQLYTVDEVHQILSQDQPLNGYVLITDTDGQSINAAISVRLLRPSQIDDLANAMEPVIYVPWSARVSQVLDQLNDDDRSVAVVVNEFGEVIGAVTIDDILQYVFASRHTHEMDTIGEATIQMLEENHYRVHGSASARALAKRLGIETVEEGVTTVAGLIQRHNERLPRVGDRAPLDRYTLEVVEEKDDAVWIDVRVVDERLDSPETTS